MMRNVARRKVVQSAAIVGLTLVLLCQAHNAHAICASNTVIAPGPGAMNVPLNTLLWCGPEPREPERPLVITLTVIGAESAVDNGPLQLTEQTLLTEELEVSVLVPEQELLPNTQYLFDCDGTEHSFRTGTDRAHQQPEIPAPSPVTYFAETDGYRGDVYFAEFLRAGVEGTLVVINRDGLAELSNESPAGSVNSLLDTTQFFEAISFGKGECLANWPDATHGAAASVSLGAFDLAGNFSGWSEEIALIIPLQDTALQNVEDAQLVERVVLIPADEGKLQTSDGGCSTTGTAEEMPEELPYGMAIGVAFLIARRRRGVFKKLRVQPGDAAQ